MHFLDLENLLGLEGLLELERLLGVVPLGDLEFDWSCLLELAAPNKNFGRPNGFGKGLCRTGLVPIKTSRVSSINDSVKLRRATVSQSQSASIESTACCAIA